MPVYMKFILFALLGFGLGGILFSYHLPKLFKGIDICEVSEDHNPGTYNAIHYAGVPVGILCLLCDLMKGFLPVFFAMRMLDYRMLPFALVLAAPVLGHACAPLYRKKGGKAVAVTFGALLGLLPESMAVFLLAALYLFFSVAIVINPHEKRTVVVFFLFTALAAVGAAFTGRWSIALGCAAISCIVMLKNRAGIPEQKGEPAKEEPRPAHVP